MVGTSLSLNVKPHRTVSAREGEREREGERASEDDPGVNML